MEVAYCSTRVLKKNIVCENVSRGHTAQFRTRRTGVWRQSELEHDRTFKMDFVSLILSAVEHHAAFILAFLALEGTQLTLGFKLGNNTGLAT